jgi:hypothetical protein
LQAEARKELGQDVQRIEANVHHESVSVIRFEALPPRVLSEEGGDEVIEGDFAEIPEPADTEFRRVLELQGVSFEAGHPDPEHNEAIRRAIAERGLDPRDALSDDQFREVYGREKGDDPWVI